MYLDLTQAPTIYYRLLPSTASLQPIRSLFHSNQFLPSSKPTSSTSIMAQDDLPEWQPEWEFDSSIPLDQIAETDWSTNTEVDFDFSSFDFGAEVPIAPTAAASNIEQIQGTAQIEMCHHQCEQPKAYVPHTLPHHTRI
jgi:hypothetical protein